MSLKKIITRGFGILKAGMAFRDSKSADDDEKRHRAQHYLVSVLGESRGLPAKIAQMMTMDGGDAGLRETLNESIPAMPFSEVKSILQAAYGAPHDSIFRSLESKGRVASLGQVHFGKLPDGREVAVKVQFPGISGDVDAELTLLGFLPKMGPVSRWGFDLKSYRDTFWKKMDEELNYSQEIRAQERYRQLAAPLNDVVVPEVITPLCRPNVLVQIREDGKSFDEIEKSAPISRQAAGRALLRHYLHMIFRHGFVHADPHPGNFAARLWGSGQDCRLIVYDYGCVLELPENLRLALLRIILALREREPVDPAACLAALGFDVAKLHDLRATLPALLQVLFDPFTSDAPYDVNHWQINERFDGIVGELKWWFRSAAPPELIYLMRTLHGMTTLLKRLDSKLPWGFLLDKLCSDIYPQARALRLPEVPPPPGRLMAFNNVASYLKVHVKKTSGSVQLTMPARCADDLEGIIDEPVKETIAKQGLDLAAIQRQVRRKGFTPQVIFEVQDAVRWVKVWLE